LMNVYQRPLFRQMGGPVAPGMAAQEAMMPQAAGMPPAAAAQDPMAMAQQVQDMAAQQTQGIGEQYAQATLMNIDQAETPEQIINALRGNEVPLEQRYAELAQFVGEADAQRTPESVLALVQPTIMMTEQGAMDSGIGELMQGLTGEIEMETADGAPTAMGQGVGSLMMAGANAAPEMGVGQQPVANFRQGGVVQRFQAGGEASRLQQLYSEMLPTYQSILGDGGEQRRLTQAQILFDIADRAGAFAAGVDPRTGQSIARLSPAAQLAAATSGLGGQIGERLGSQEEQDRALRLAALQAAQGEFSAERAAARAAAAAGGSRGIGDAYEAVDAEGNVIATEFLATQAQMDAFRLANEGAIVRKAVAPRIGLTDEDYFTKFGMTRAEFEALSEADRRGLLNLDTIGLTDEDYFTKFGMTRAEFEALPEADQRRLRNLDTTGLTDEDYFTKFGMTRAEFEALSEADQRRLRNLDTTGLTDEDYFTKFGMTRAAFEALPEAERRRLLNLDTGEIGKQYEAVDAQGNVLASAFLADKAAFDKFVADYPNTTVREAIAQELGDEVLLYNPNDLERSSG
jgi:hypothetical protein